MSKSKLVSLTDTTGNKYVLNKKYVVKIEKNSKGYTMITYEIPSSPSCVEFFTFNQSVDEIFNMFEG